MTNMMDQPIADLAAALRSGQLHAVDLIERAIERHDRYGAGLDAYVDWSPDHARRQAAVADAYRDVGGPLRPLFGLPFSVKDLYGVEGYRTRAGSPEPLPREWEAEGPIVAGLREQLGVVMGKTHTVHFAFGGVGTNPHHPTPRNPWDIEDHRVSGGSSSGAGVSLAEGSALIALASDTGGSVRIPASVTGNAGLKTSTGRWSLDGIVPLSPALDTAGILARTVADLAYGFAAFDPTWGEPDAFLSVTPSLSAADLHLGVADEFFWDGCSPGVAEGVGAALDELRKAGARLSNLPLPEAEEAYTLFRQGTRVAPELHTFLTTELPDRMASLDPNVGRRMGPAGEVTASDYLACVKRLNALGMSVAGRLRDVDIHVCPTVAITAPTIEEVASGDDYRRNNLMMLRNTGMINYFDLCAVTIPVARDAAGSPVGLQLTARHGHEEHLLAVALACERVLGTGAERFGLPPR